jgi:NAD(P)-dependent dehydrogenase (short-subunit alcohol dehydrogenase family)
MRRWTYSKCIHPAALDRANADPKISSYPLSKVWEILAVRYLATLIPVSRTGVVVNLVSPGLCITDLSRNSPPEFKEKLALMWEKMGRTAEDGSRTLLHAAIAGRESHGRYLNSCEIAE